MGSTAPIGHSRTPEFDSFGFDDVGPRNDDFVAHGFVVYIWGDRLNLVYPMAAWTELNLEDACALIKNLASVDHGEGDRNSQKPCVVQDGVDVDELVQVVDYKRCWSFNERNLAPSDGGTSDIRLLKESKVFVDDLWVEPKSSGAVKEGDVRFENIGGGIFRLLQPLFEGSERVGTIVCQDKEVQKPQHGS